MIVRRTVDAGTTRSADFPVRSNGPCSSEYARGWAVRMRSRSGGWSGLESPMATPFGRTAFTLIELILVMAILTIAVSITAPALANFFHGRVLDSEGRRLLAATHAAQSRAISEAVPVSLWFDSSQNQYGIEAETGAYEKDQKAETLTMDHHVALKVTTLNIGASRANGSSGMSSGSRSFSQQQQTLQGPHANL